MGDRCGWVCVFLKQTHSLLNEQRIPLAFRKGLSHSMFSLSRPEVTTARTIMPEAKSRTDSLTLAGSTAQILAFEFPFHTPKLDSYQCEQQCWRLYQMPIAARLQEFANNTFVCKSYEEVESAIRRVGPRGAARERS
jgi:hypothetical protein